MVRKAASLRRPRTRLTSRRFLRRAVGGALSGAPPILRFPKSADPATCRASDVLGVTTRRSGGASPLAWGHPSRGSLSETCGRNEAPACKEHLDMPKCNCCQVNYHFSQATGLARRTPAPSGRNATSEAGKTGEISEIESRKLAAPAPRVSTNKYLDTDLLQYYIPAARRFSCTPSLSPTYPGCRSLPSPYSVWRACWQPAWSFPWFFENGQSPRTLRAISQAQGEKFF